MMAEHDPEAIVFTYRNHRNEDAKRRVRPIEIYFGSTEWHPQPQWLLSAFDLDKEVFRKFAMADIQGIDRLGARTKAPEPKRNLESLKPGDEVFVRAIVADNIGARMPTNWPIQIVLDHGASETVDTGGKVHFSALYASPIPPQLEGVSEAVADIAAERRRQTEVEGWTPEHDDQHDKGELSRAAGNYVGAAALTLSLDARSFGATPPFSGWLGPFDWPWDIASWKPGDVRRMLVKAGALIVAEIERLDRAALEAAAKVRGRS